jgi:preprotein translocase subunit SecB
MRRSLAIGTLTTLLVGLTGGSALATGDHPAPDAEDAGPGQWAPVDPAYYEEAIQAEACGSIVTITAGNVREIEERVTELATGEVLTEFRGAATVDLVRESDGAVIDELDIGGPGFDLTQVVGDEVRITQVLYGASILFPYAGSAVDVAAFEEAGIPDLAYFADPEQSVEVEIVVDAESGEPLEVEFDEIDAELVDLCGSFEHRHW